MYTHVIFDLDGTLLNTIDDLTDAGNYVCAAHGWPTHTVEQFKRMVGNGIPTLVSRLAPEGTDEGELAAALAEFSAWYDAHKADKTAPYGGVPQVVDALKAAGVTVAVLSNKAHALAESVVEGYYPGVFDAVQGALPDVPVKPDPTLLNKLMEQLGADRAHTLFVGDSNVDIQTGKNGGLATCGVLWGFRSRRELELAGADHIVEHPGQMAALVTGTELLMPGQTERAAQLLRQGKLVAVPTETVYGLAADATQAGAVHANYEAKGRPDTKPLNVLVDGMTMVENVCQAIPPDAYRLAEAFWPGPLTMILWGNGTLPDIVPAGGGDAGRALSRSPGYPGGDPGAGQAVGLPVGQPVRPAQSQVGPGGLRPAGRPHRWRTGWRNVRRGGGVHHFGPDRHPVPHPAPRWAEPGGHRGCPGPVRGGLSISKFGVM